MQTFTYKHAFCAKFFHPSEQYFSCQNPDNIIVFISLSFVFLIYILFFSYKLKIFMFFFLHIYCLQTTNWEGKKAKAKTTKRNRKKVYSLKHIFFEQFLILNKDISRRSHSVREKELSATVVRLVSVPIFFMCTTTRMWIKFWSLLLVTYKSNCIGI